MLPPPKIDIIILHVPVRNSQALGVNDGDTAKEGDGAPHQHPIFKKLTVDERLELMSKQMQTMSEAIVDLAKQQTQMHARFTECIIGQHGSNGHNTSQPQLTKPSWPR